MLQKIEVLEKPVEVRADMHLKLEPKFQSGNDVLQVEGLSKAFGPLALFDNLSFDLKKGEHVAIIGDNGTGKTTILKIINELLPLTAEPFIWAQTWPSATMTRSIMCSTRKRHCFRKYQTIIRI